MPVDFRDRIGILGGGFNPPHIGHLFIAVYALSALGLKKVIVIPCRDHPFGKELAPFQHRLEMCKLAFSPIAGTEVSDIEERLPTPSYTINTLSALGELYPKEKFLLLLGVDQSEEFARWKDFDRIKELADIMLFRRGGRRGKTDAFETTEITLPEISSTDLRERLKMSGNSKGLIPDSVSSYIKRHKLYR
ncbi:MAG: nicotinate-nucleotide adenylyltransferase [Myxococcota bacterium]